MAPRQHHMAAKPVVTNTPNATPWFTDLPKKLAFWNGASLQQVVLTPKESNFILNHRPQYLSNMAPAEHKSHKKWKLCQRRKRSLLKSLSAKLTNNPLWRFLIKFGVKSTRGKEDTCFSLNHWLNVNSNARNLTTAKPLCLSKRAASVSFKVYSHRPFRPPLPRSFGNRKEENTPFLLSKSPVWPIGYRHFLFPQSMQLLGAFLFC